MTSEVRDNSAVRLWQSPAASGTPQTSSDAWFHLKLPTSRRTNKKFFHDLDARLSGRGARLTGNTGVQLGPMTLSASQANARVPLPELSARSHLSTGVIGNNPGLGLQQRHDRGTMSTFMWGDRGFGLLGCDGRLRGPRNSSVDGSVMVSKHLRFRYRGEVTRPSRLREIARYDPARPRRRADVTYHRVELCLGEMFSMSLGSNIGRLLGVGSRLDLADGKDVIFETHRAGPDLAGMLGGSLWQRLAGAGAALLPDLSDPRNLQIYDKVTFHTTSTAYAAGVTTTLGGGVASQVMAQTDQVVQIQRSAASIVDVEYRPSEVAGLRQLAGTFLGTQVGVSSFHLSLRFAKYRIDLSHPAGLAAYTRILARPPHLGHCHHEAVEVPAGAQLLSHGEVDDVHEMVSLQQRVGTLPLCMLPLQAPCLVARHWSSGREQVTKRKHNQPTTRTITGSREQRVYDSRRGAASVRAASSQRWEERGDGSYTFRSLAVCAEYSVNSLRADRLERDFLRPLSLASRDGFGTLEAHGENQGLAVVGCFERTDLLLMANQPVSEARVVEAAQRANLDPRHLRHFLTLLRDCARAAQRGPEVPESVYNAYASCIEQFIETQGPAFIGALGVLFGHEVPLKCVANTAAVERLRMDVGEFCHLRGPPLAGQHSLWQLRRRLRQADVLMGRVHAVRQSYEQTTLHSGQQRQESVADLARFEATLREALRPAAAARSRLQAQRQSRLLGLFDGRSQQQLAHLLEPGEVEVRLAAAQRAAQVPRFEPATPAPYRQARLRAWWVQQRRAQRDLALLRHMARTPGIVSVEACNRVRARTAELLPRLRAAVYEATGPGPTRRDLWKGFPWLWFFTPTGWSLLIALIFHPRPQP